MAKKQPGHAIFAVVLVVAATQELPMLAAVLTLGFGVLALTRWKATRRAP